MIVTISDMMSILNIDYPLLDQKPEKRLLYLNIIINIIHSNQPFTIKNILDESDANTFCNLINSGYKDIFLINDYSISKKEIIEGEIVLGIDILLKDIQDKKLNPFNIYQVPTMENKDDALLKRVDLTLNILKSFILNPDFFNLWLFKYFDNMLIPHDNTGYTIYKTYFDGMKIDELKTYFKSEIINSEIRRLQRRESNNQISYSDCIRIIEYINKFMETLDSRSKEYQADNIKEMIKELTDGRYDTGEKTGTIKNDQIILLVDGKLKKGIVTSQFKDMQVVFVNKNILTRSIGPRYIVISQILKKFESANLIIADPLKIIGVEEAKQLIENGIDAGPSVEIVKDYLSKC